MTSVIKIIELTNFGLMTASTIQFKLRNKILLVTPWAEIMTL